MTPTSIFGGEVARLEEALVAAKRAQDNAERDAKRLADLLTVEKREHSATSRDLGISREQVATLEMELEKARGQAGKVAEAERKASDEGKRAAKLEKERDALAAKWAKVTAERDDARAQLVDVTAESLRLQAEIEPTRALAAAITVWHDAGQKMVEEAKKIRAEP